MIRRAVPTKAAPRYFTGRRVVLTERDAEYAGDGVLAGTYELHPKGSWRRVSVYRRSPRKGSRGTPQLRRVKHAPTIRAVLTKLEGEDAS